MDLFEQFAAKKNRKQGKFKARLNAKWVNLSRVKTPQKEMCSEDVTHYLATDKKAPKLIRDNFEDLTVEFNDDNEIVDNVTVYEYTSGGLSDDSRSIKWLDVVFHFDTRKSIEKDWSEIEDSLRFNFYCDIEVEGPKGYIVFQFSDWEDNSVELIK